MSPLSELVWSPDEGLSIKIAASSLSTRKASLQWNADTLSIVISSPQQSGGTKSGDNICDNLEVSEKMPSQLQPCSDSSARAAMASPNRITNLDAIQSTSMRSQEQDSKCCEGINLMNEGKEGFENCCMDKPQDVEVGISPTRCCKDASQSSASRKEVMPSISENQGCCATTVHNETLCATNAWRARLIKAVCQKDSMLPKSTENALSPSSLGISCEAGTLAGFLGSRNVQTAGNDSKIISNIPAVHSCDNHQDLILQESQKEEPVVARAELAYGINALARRESTPGVNAIKLAKGKEKIVDNNSNCVSNTKESDDSNESIESCPSTKAPKRKHEQCSAASMPSRKKRCSRDDNGSSCSGLLQKCGTSFFNWMSSLTNGLTMLDEATAAVPLDQKFSTTTGEGSAAPPLPLQINNSIPMQSVGFNSLFKSLYSHNVTITSTNACHNPENNCTENALNGLTLQLNGSSSMLDKQIGMGTQTLAAERFQMVSGGGKENFHNQINIFPLPNSSKFCSRSVEEKQNECTAGCSITATRYKSGVVESLWISRLLPKTSAGLVEVTPCNVESTVDPKGVGDELYCSSFQNFNVEKKEMNDIQHFSGRGSSDGATSSKCPAMPPEESKQSETMASVFAKRLDALRHAKTSAVKLAIACDHGTSKRINHKTNSFVVSYSSHDELEVGQETHKSSSGNRRIVLRVGDEGKEQLCARSNEELGGDFLSDCKNQHHGGSITGKSANPRNNLEANTLDEDIDRRIVELKGGVSDFVAGLADNKQIVPYGIMSNNICDESSFLFGALHRLRLSRSNIISWLRSPVMHTTLDGFFVRLRFGKWEEALGGTGYHVARLNGALDRSCLSVTIRNATCQVDSRFVSNHDFHEDELKAWWSAAMKGEWKLPSKEELSMKLRERELIHS